MNSSDYWQKTSTWWCWSVFFLQRCQDTSCWGKFVLHRNTEEQNSDTKSMFFSSIVLIQSGKGPEATSGLAQQQQGTWQASPLNQSIQRKVTMMAQQQSGPGATPLASRGGLGDAQQSRVRHETDISPSLSLSVFCFRPLMIFSPEMYLLPA